MLTNVNFESTVAVYVQIENDVRFAIASGRLKGGDQLPSVRELSERLDLNPNTVAKAYRDLEVMGYLYTRRGMGVFVSKGIEAKCRADCRKSIIQRLYEVVAESKAAGFSSSEALDLVRKCLGADLTLYGETPGEILSLAKRRAARK